MKDRDPGSIVVILLGVLLGLVALVIVAVLLFPCLVLLVQWSVTR